MGKPGDILATAVANRTHAEGLVANISQIIGKPLDTRHGPAILLDQHLLQSLVVAIEIFPLVLNGETDGYSGDQVLVVERGDIDLALLEPGKVALETVNLVLSLRSHFETFALHAREELRQRPVDRYSLEFQVRTLLHGNRVGRSIDLDRLQSPILILIVGFALPHTSNPKTQQYQHDNKEKCEEFFHNTIN